MAQDGANGVGGISASIFAVLKGSSMLAQFPTYKFRWNRLSILGILYIIPTKVRWFVTAKSKFDAPTVSQRHSVANRTQDAPLAWVW